MRTSSVTVAAVAASSICFTASAALVEVIDLGSVVLGPGDSVFIPYDNLGNTLDLAGFTVTFDFAYTPEDPFMTVLAQHLAVVFEGLEFAVGGDSLGYGWDFSGSQRPGYFEHLSTIDLFAVEGWSFSKADLKGFTLTTDLIEESPPGAWSNITLTLYKIPSPGALVAFGLAGLLGSRRRRA